MPGRSLVRFIELVRRELEADDARVEIGGKDPSGSGVIWQPFANHWRIVAIFSGDIEDRERCQEKLRGLVAAFSGAERGLKDIDEAERQLAAPAARALDDELAGLAERSDAVGCVVIDNTSPVIWGSSAPRHGREDVDSAMWTADACEVANGAGLDLVELLDLDAEEVLARIVAARVKSELSDRLVRDVTRIRESSRRSGPAWWRHHLVSARAIAAVRRRARTEEHAHRLVHHDANFGYLARNFANIYWLTLAFGGDFSELHAEGAVVHLLPLVERLVLSLPPVDPSPKGGRVLRFPTS